MNRVQMRFRSAGRAIAAALLRYFSSQPRVRDANGRLWDVTVGDLDGGVWGVIFRSPERIGGYRRWFAISVDAGSADAAVRQAVPAMLRWANAEKWMRYNK